MPVELEDDDLPGGTVTSLDPAPKKKAKPQPVVEEEEDEPAPKPKHPARLVQLAKQFGFTDADIAEYSTEALHAEVGRNQQWAIDEARRAARAKETPAKKDEPEEDFDLGPEAEGFDEASKKLLKRIALAGRKEAKELKEKLQAKIEALEQQHAARRSVDINTMLDDAFDSLPKKFKKVFGDGSGSDAAFLQTAEGRRCNSVLQQVNVDPSKVTAKAMRQAVLNAAEAIFGFIESPEEEDEPEPTPKPKKKTPPKDPENGRFTVDDFKNGKVAKGSDRQTGLDQQDVHAGVAQILRSNGYTATLDGEMGDLPG